MNIVTDRQYMIFRKDNEFGTFYKVGLSKKDMNGNYINGYKDVRFKKGVNIENKTIIYIKKAWLDFYLKDGKTRDYIFISEFETLENTIKKNHTEIKQSDPYEEVGREVKQDSMDLYPEDNLPF